VRLTIIGCAGSYPSASSAASCYLVEAEGFGLVLDLGSGALGPLARHTDIYRIGAIALSHLHPDHCFDVCSYFVARRFHPEGPFPRIPIFGPQQTEQRLARAYAVTELPDLSTEFDFRAYPDESFRIGPFTARAALVEHPVPTYAIRLEHDGSSFAYSGDTGPTPVLVELAKSADLLLCEATFRPGDDNPAGMHLTASEAGEHASEAGARRLVLTHLPPWVPGEDSAAEARESFPGEVSVAVAGATYEL
jgi:ribonuclease BN (tRNA processing enzyme)